MKANHSNHSSDQPLPAGKTVSTRVATSLALVLLGAGTATTGAYYAWGQPRNLEPVAANAAQPTYETVPASLAVPAEVGSVADVVQAVGPAVVRINASRTVTSQSPQVPEAFRQFFGNQVPSGEPQERTSVASGRGLSCRKTDKF